MKTENHIIKIQPLNSELLLIKNLKDLISKKYSEFFYAVIVHGSVATEEIIPYSDFDGLLIVKDEWVNTKELKKFKVESLRYIYQFDPLQHHGWFEIKESDLLNYPENYLPINTLKYSKVIFPENRPLKLELKRSFDVDYNTFLFKMLDQFEKRELEKWRPKNSYQLKSFLSQIMLIPCLYYSAVNNDGIFKRESFIAVRDNFSEKEWMPIVVSSKIRIEWNYKISGFKRLLFGVQNRYFRKIVTRFFAPKISSRLGSQIDEEFYNNLMLFIRKIKKDIL